MASPFHPPAIPPIPKHKLHLVPARPLPQAQPFEDARQRQTRLALADNIRLNALLDRFWANDFVDPRGAVIVLTMRLEKQQQRLERLLQAGAA